MWTSYLIGLFLIAQTVYGLSPYCGAPPVDLPNVPGGYDIVQSHVLIRHGDRQHDKEEPCWENYDTEWDCSGMTNYITPTLPSVTPKRIFRQMYTEGDNATPGNCRLAQLTSKGYEQHIMNGKGLGSRYIHQYGLVKDIHNDMRIRSTDYVRTFDSAAALLEGMFPTSEQEGLEKVNIITTDHQTDPFVPQPGQCHIVKEKVSDAVRSHGFRMHREDMNPLYNKLKGVFGHTDYNFSPDNAMDCLSVHHCHGKAIPAGLTDNDVQAMIDDYIWRYSYYLTYPDRNTTRAFIGRAVKVIDDALESTMMGRTDVKMALWSAHDSTLLSFMSAFSNIPKSMIPYASHIVLEILKDRRTGNLFVNSYYNNEAFVVPGCPDHEPCPIATFRHSYKDVLVIPGDRFCDHMMNW
eukprot:TRINITY_DN1630_c0_g1_i1.p1 TRINITY_DN1630_c0_g1~~TRINITY_DN1630_c0_g1_i1.p1  ORF type:complete len:440 (+),score=61.62 TRINITY_DN1630_c0_g1_i1:100-1320(+)